MTEATAIRWEQDADRIVTLTLDDPNQSANTMNDLFRRSMETTVARLEKEKDNITGIIVTSAKKTFFAGGDLRDLIRVQPAQAGEFMAGVTAMKAQMRRLETLGMPVVAALNGTALGGGMEIALACHRRIAINDPKAQFGLPEVTLGLLPGGGGVVRTVRMLGIQNALMNVLLQGQRLNPEKAKSAGLIDELVATREELLDAARRWIKANPAAIQPWDQKGYKIPGGTPSVPAFAQNLPAFPANLRKQLKGANYPAPRNILSAAVEGAQVDFDTALRIESRYFTDLVVGQTSKNMTQAFFFDLQHINSGGSRPKDVAKYEAKKVGVLGAGMMGAGVAYVCARAGMEVVLKDVSLEGAQKGRAYSEKLLDAEVAKGRLTKDKRDALLARILATGKAADFAGCDLVIEAVFEDVALKHKVFQEIEGIVRPDCLLASNTSSLPITELATGVKKPESFIGLHFFSPVEKMPLIEIIRGKKTSNESLARAYDVTMQLKKTPIVVNDSHGFFTSRVIGTVLNEAVGMLGEGLNPNSIEQAATQAGYPVGMLALMDELTLTLPRKLREEAKKALTKAGRKYVPHAADAVVDRMVETYGRRGKSAGAGFYDYPASGKKHLWPGLMEHFVKPGAEIPFADMQERMLFIEALETVKCIEEGVILSMPDANIGSIFGIGYPAWTGGVVQYMNGYAGGLAGFVTRTRELAKRYGERFNPPALLVQKAEQGKTFA